MNEVYTGKMSRMDFVEYAESKNQNYASAVDLLILCGPDGFDGDANEYYALLDKLTKEAMYRCEL